MESKQNMCHEFLESLLNNFTGLIIRIQFKPLITIQFKLKYLDHIFINSEVRRNTTHEFFKFLILIPNYGRRETPVAMSSNLEMEFLMGE